MAAIKWASGISGDWTDGADWTGGVAPGAGDNVTIAARGAFTVTISSGDAAHSLTLDNAKATIVDTGALTLGSTLALAAGTFALDRGGAINGGTLSAGAGAFLFNGGTLNGVTFDGTINVASQEGLTLGASTVEGAINLSGANYASLTVLGGLQMTGAGGTGAGTIDISGRYCALDFRNTQTLDNATINIGATSGNAFIALYNSTDAGVTLTLGGQVTINQTGAYTEIRGGAGFVDDAVVNEGVINASYMGGDFSITPYTFTNAGIINVTNGDTLTLGQFEYSWSNTGTIAVTNATVDLRYGFTTAALGSFVNNGGTVNIDGTLNNASSTLNVGAGANLETITLTRLGAISGGTISDVGPGIVFNGGTLNGATFEGTLDLSSLYSKLRINNGLIAEGVGGTGAGTIDLTGYDSAIYFQATQTFGNATIDIGSARGFASIEELPTNGAGTLTLGVNLAIDQTGKFARITSDYQGASIVSAGTIDASFHDGRFHIGGPTFTNAGTIAVSNGDILDLEPHWLTNLASGRLSGGQFEVDAGSTLELAQNQSVTTDNAVIILSGTGSNLQSMQTDHVLVTIDSTLASITATGTLELLAGRDWSSTIAMTNAGTLDLGGGSFAPASLNNIGVVSGEGVIDAQVADAGVIEAVSGTLELSQSITGKGDLRVDAGATLQADTSVAARLAVTFEGVGGVLALTKPSAFKATIAAFASGDTIDLLQKTATAATLEAGDELVIVDGTKTVATLQLSGNYSGDNFAVSSDGHGGTDITLSTTAAPPTATTPATAWFVQAMAAPGGGSAWHAGENVNVWRSPSAMLASPRVMMA